jgi:transcriptional regulator with XRE-family HTH domain
MHALYMSADRIGPAGKVLAANIHRIRTRAGLTFAELSARTQEIGQPIAILGLRRIERGERRVDFDDLLILAVALDTAPVNLMVPLLSDTVPYPIGDREYGCETVRRWIAGGDLDRDRTFAEPIGIPDVAELDHLLQWLPEERRKLVLRDWLNEQYDPTPEEEEEAWLKEQAAKGDQS